MANSAHILVVDDHKEIRELLARYLANNGLQVSVASGGVEMRQALRRANIKLVVLDIMMPGEDGFTLCHELRQTSDLPVILLTALADDAERVIGLELGADDYVTKPFNPRELLARIKAVLRRSSDSKRLAADQQTKRLGFAGWVLDIQRRELTSPVGILVGLGTAEFNLLLAFARRPGLVLSREQLLDVSAGRTAHVFDRSIDNLVTKLRKHIEDDPKKPSLIKTVWGQGYCFAAEVEVLQ